MTSHAPGGPPNDASADGRATALLGPNGSLDAWDISPTVNERSAVFPGDRAYRRNIAMSFESGHLALSSIDTTVHIGAHADAPSHYAVDGGSIDTRDVRRYMGPCQVVSVPSCTRITPTDLPAPVLAPRVLFATNSFRDPNSWQDGFGALSPELVHFLADRGVTLLGIDTPSIDPANDRQMLAHKAVFARDLAVLEGLVLADVPEGVYTLVALPLRLRGADASPVRALLLRSPEVLAVG
jgi:arylformamidase